MAYAAITETLKGRVKQKILALSDAEYESTVKPDTITAKISVDAIVRADATDALWDREPVADLRERLKPYDKQGNIKLNIYSDAGDTPESASKLVAVVHVKDIPLPCFLVEVGGYYSQKDIEVTMFVGHNPLFGQLQEAVAAKKELDERWKKVRMQVIAFLDNCKSANEAVKLWPDVARYFDEETVKKLNTKSEKAQRTTNALDALKALDMDAVETSTVLARMAGAKI